MPIAIPIDEDGKQVLVPAVAADGSPLSQEQALAQYQASGQHYGKFDTAENALAYANTLPGAAPPAPAVAAPDTVAAAGMAPGAPAAPAAVADTGAPAPGAAPVALGPTARTPPTIQPIPTGQPPVPGTEPPAPAPAPANRTGLPMPAEVWQRIQADPTLRNDAERALAFSHAETIYRTQEAALAQQARLEVQAQQQQLQNAENAIYADVYSASPKITPQQIAVDPRFNGNPERRKNMIELVNNPPGSGIPAPQSYLAAQQLIDRMRLPQGDPNKITSRDQIYDQMKSLNRADLDFALKKYDELSSPGDSRFSHRLEEFFKGVTPQIDKSGVVPGLPSDARGKAKAYEYQRFVEDHVDQYKKAGKNPDDLLNPKKPDYLGSPETLKPYKRTLKQAMEDFNADLATSPDALPELVGTDDQKKAQLKAWVGNDETKRALGEAEALRRKWIQPATPSGVAAPLAVPSGQVPAPPSPAAAPPGP